jgi:hypothetical protein
MGMDNHDAGDMRREYLQDFKRSLTEPTIDDVAAAIGTLNERQ